MRRAHPSLRRQFPKIVEALPRYAGLPGDPATLTVVVTRDYAA